MEFSVRAAVLTTLLESRITNFYTNFQVDEIGRVVSVGDGIARVYGLNEIQARELVEFSSGVKGIALNLENENVRIVVFGSDTSIKEGDLVKRNGSIVDVPAGKAMLGRVVDGLGVPIDGRGALSDHERRRVENVTQLVQILSEANALEYSILVATGCHNLALMGALCYKLATAAGAQAFHLALLKLGCPNCMASAIGVVVRSVWGDFHSYPQMVTSSEGPNLGGRNFRWTDLFGSNYTESSEASVNQPDSPNPGEPTAPTTEYNPLLGDGQRRQELKDRLAINLIGKTLGVIEDDILDTQYEIELRMEKALRSDRFTEDSLLEGWHRIRGVLFYPYGRPLSLDTYRRHLQFMENYGTHHSVPYKRLMDSIYSQYSLNLKKAFPNGTNAAAPSVQSLHDFALVVRGLPNRTKMDRAVGSEKVSGTGMVFKQRFHRNRIWREKENQTWDTNMGGHVKSLEFGHESNSTSRPRSEDVVNFDYGKDKEVHRDWLKAKSGATGEEAFRKLESGSER
ncbi:hypothetical protein TSUD_85500 [Trifolium subterraneum]|uniref:ATPase F1/V1/A1 complex alpha/beta subunit N-terminal domain-containing protein n=1 Tax=Trifolium subterraneum TaxID=3900 RepID=A0A2Z6PKT8_TRISU|nr:hypothetical protein TSUD_85500 [Trifolium subterraneum]